ncbi:unnamed protein product [Prorocentrum cordatum]|uniref:Glutathione transferase n=1 Tax=Prorocentrum cordatum TaxID=2364126 RepID=A0ABN9TME4_9DINO|nr:unnamed protein product [Polarella glacialis]
MEDGHLTAPCHEPSAVAAGDDRELIIWRGSQYSVKALAALHLKGFARPSVDYRLSVAPLDFKSRRVLLPAPHTVPVLRWDGEVITGTNVCAFLDSRFPGEAALYPEGCADEVRRLEGECAVIYWLNGWLSFVDPDGFERYAGALARRHIDSGGAGAAAKVAGRLLPRRVVGRVVNREVAKIS